jgi:hypothetical protein
MAVMKTRILAGLFVGVWAGLTALTVQAQNIAPYGDSVTTFGADPESSYRYWLYQKLSDAGFSFNFVGTGFGADNGTPANSWPDEQFSGHEGWSAADAAANVDAVIATSPDIVLLDFGSNDYDPAAGVKACLAEVRSSLDATMQSFAAYKSDIIILLAKPTPWVAHSAGEKKFMSGLSGAVSKAAKDEKKAGVHVIVVNLYGGFNARKDTMDGSHPNVIGEQKIANKYFQSLKKVL